MSCKLGDIVCIEGRLVGFGQTDFIIRDVSNIKVLATPPKIGDTVWWDADPKRCYHKHACSYWGSTLIYIHQEPDDDRKWAVVAFKGDIPQSIPFNDIRTTRECVD